MKRIVALIILTFAVAVPSARAINALPFFGDLRNQVVAQQVLGSNDVVANKKLLASLKKALKTIDKTKPTYVAGAKSLGMLAKTLNRTSVSNAFVGDFEATLEDYLAALMGEENSLSTRLASAFPSKSHTSALTALDLLDEALIRAAGTNDIIAAAKFLSTAAKDLGKAAKLTDKAEDAPAPAAQVDADISGALNTSIKTQGAAVTGVPSQFNLLGGTGSPTNMKTIQFGLQNVMEGTHIVAVINGNFNITSSQPAIYSNGSGTATVTYNSASHSLYGTFTFIATGTGPSSGTVTVSGSFSGTTPP